MRIAISTIAKNEKANVEDFVASCGEADLISVLDTGSTDGTEMLLKKHGALAGKAKIKPFRFDEARNKALDLLPDDIDVVISIDMDERLQPGWREALEGAWQEDFDGLSYWYIAEWKDKANAIPSVSSWRTKIFKRKGTKWFRPVHEVLLLEDGSYPRGGMCRDIEVRHHQNGRRNYEPLLSGLIKASPNDEDAYIQRGAEWLALKEYQKAIDDYEKYLALTVNKGLGHPESSLHQMITGRRANAHICIAQAKHKLGQHPQMIVNHFLKAVAECPSLREAWTYLADGFFSTGNYPAAYGAAMTALGITNSGIHAKDQRCWGDFPKDLADNAFAKILVGTELQENTMLPKSSAPSTASSGPRIGQILSDESMAEHFSYLLNRVSDVSGDIIECGVSHGYSFTQIALALYKSGKKRTLYGLDTWDVMPKSGSEDKSLLRSIGITESLAQFEDEGSQGTRDEVLGRLESAGIPKRWIDKHVILKKGLIKDTLPKLSKVKFAFVHLDVDTYASYKVALKYLWPLLARNGIMALDEYGDVWWPGARQAVDEYFSKRVGEFKFELARAGNTGRYFVEKLVAKDKDKKKQYGSSIRRKTKRRLA